MAEKTEACLFLQMGFVCSVCGRINGRKADLERHMLTHTGVRPHTCPHCTFACNRSSNLYRHIRSAHPSFMPDPINTHSTIPYAQNNSTDIILDQNI